MARFRFESLDIWKLSVDICIKLFKIATDIDDLKMFRVSSQLRSAALSISNNIAEGSGSKSSRDFLVFLNYAHRSVFECANIIYILYYSEIISVKTKDSSLEDLDKLGRKITAFSRAVR
jgi:four helix bundle protein